MLAIYNKRVKDLESDYNFLKKIEPSMTDSRADVIFMVRSVVSLESDAQKVAQLKELIKSEYVENYFDETDSK